MRKWAGLALLLQGLLAGAQNFTGTWEGSLRIDGDRKREMIFRMELKENDSGQFLGVIYARAYEENTFMACDMIVAGSRKGKQLILEREKFQRNINLSPFFCEGFRQLELVPGIQDSGLVLRGNWVTEFSIKHPVTCQRTEEVLSVSAMDILNGYADELYAEYERLHILLPPAQRKMVELASRITDRDEVILEVYGANASDSDSISVLMDGDTVLLKHSLYLKPLSLRIRPEAGAESMLTIINESVVAPYLDLKLVLKEGRRTEELTCKPSHTRNYYFRIARKQISH